MRIAIVRTNDTTLVYLGIRCTRYTLIQKLQHAQTDKCFLRYIQGYDLSEFEITEFDLFNKK